MIAFCFRSTILVLVVGSWVADSGGVLSFPAELDLVGWDVSPMFICLAG